MFKKDDPGALALLETLRALLKGPDGKPAPVIGAGDTRPVLVLSMTRKSVAQGGSVTGVKLKNAPRNGVTTAADVICTFCQKGFTAHLLRTRPGFGDAGKYWCLAFVEGNRHPHLIEIRDGRFIGEPSEVSASAAG